MNENDLLEFITSKAEKESNPEVGSSRIKMRGWEIVEQAIVTRRFWPPLIPRRRGEPIELEAMGVRPREVRVLDVRVLCVRGVDEGRLCMGNGSVRVLEGSGWRGDVP